MCMLCDNQTTFTEIECCLICICDNLIELPKLPKTKELYLQACTNLKEIPEFPCSLKILEISNCNSLSNIPKFPNTLKNLFLGNIKCVIPELILPPSLEILELIFLQNINKLPKLPETLTYLRIWSCNDIIELPSLPNDLKVLSLSQTNKTNKFNKIPNIPNSLIKLEMFTTNTIEIPKIPDTLEELSIDYYFQDLPKHLKILRIFDCDLQQLSKLPETLKELYLVKCEQLITLKLPSSLKILDCKYCSKLEEIDVIPENYFFHNSCRLLTFINWSKNGKILNKNEELFKDISDNYDNYRKDLCRKVSNIIKEDIIRLSYKYCLD